MIYRTVLLNEIKIHPDFDWTLDRYIKAAEQGAPIKPHYLKRGNYRRWSYVYDLLEPGGTLLDIGIGGGQFINTASHGKRFARVSGMDHIERKDLQRFSPWNFTQKSLESKMTEENRADVVTCMECIEHIPTPPFEIAVNNLKYLARKRLIVTVPFMEPEPLPKYHHQHFDLKRLRQLFPKAEFTFLARGNKISWILVDYKPEPIESGSVV